MIHPTAIVDPACQLGAGVRIGPYCVLGPEVRLGDNCELKSHVNLDGNTTFGANCVVYPFASIGTLTQDKKFKGGSPGVTVGEGSTIREYVTINTATYNGDFTQVGKNCLLMGASHVAHDCILGDGVIVANNTAIAGHVIIQDAAIVGGVSGIHQFVRMGELAIIGGCSKVVQDVPPFMMCDGNPLRVRGINKVGLERRGDSEAEVRQVLRMYKIIYKENNTMRQAVEIIRAELEDSRNRRVMLHFLEHESNRGYTRS